jgi:hypothetical protein
MARRASGQSGKSLSGSSGGSSGDESIGGYADSGNDDNAIGESGTVKNDDQFVDGNGEQSVNESYESGIDGVVEVDPAELGDFIASGGTSNSDRDEPRKERKQRKPRGPNKSKASPENIAPILSLIHTWAAVMLKTEAIQITPDEAKKLSVAYSEFSKYHSVPVLSAKRMSEINLLGALGLVYGTRIVAAVKRNKKPKLVVMPGSQQQTQ